MELVIIFALIAGQVYSQEVNETIINALLEVFSTASPSTTTCPPGELCLPGWQRVLTTTEDTGSYIEKCGEGGTAGKRMCVNYEFCDPLTDTVVRTRIGTRISIDVRKNTIRCGDPLEVCCQIPEGGSRPDVNPNGSSSTTTARPSSTASTTRPSFASNRCGIRNENGIDFTIKGNNNTLAEFGEFPWMVALIKKNPDPSDDEGFSFCGGSLISPNAVLTAGHCVFKYKSTAEEIKVRVGEWNSKQAITKFPYQERNVANIIFYKNYERSSILNDVALLILQTPVDKNEHISTVCLPDQDQVIESRTCFISGWGETVEEEGIYLDILKKIDVPMVPAGQCQETLRKTVLSQYFVLHDSLVCAGGEAGKDACTGDGGSPLVCPDPSNPRRYVLTGMVAAGIGCGSQNVPSVYVKIAKFRSWIDEQMRKLNLDTNTYIL